MHSSIFRIRSSLKRVPNSLASINGDLSRPIGKPHPKHSGTTHRPPNSNTFPNATVGNRFLKIDVVFPLQDIMSSTGMTVEDDLKHGFASAMRRVKSFHAPECIHLGQTDLGICGLLLSVQHRLTKPCKPATIRMRQKITIACR